MRCVHELFEERSAQRGGAVAIAMPDIRLSYAELNERANRLARRLHHMGVGPRGRVGVRLERSPDLLVSVLGVLKIGAAYVPLDPDYPADRLRWMMEDAQLSALILGQAPATQIAVGATPTLVVTREGLPAEPADGSTMEASADPEDMAYLMYTSGSTGKPKGVAVPHRGIARLVCAPDYVAISEEDVFLQLAPISFDASTFEIWGALLNGARLAMMPPGPVSLAQIGQAIRCEGVTILWLTGGLFNLMVDERLEDLKPVKQLLIGGETLSVAHVNKALAALENTQLINGYGPTENTTFTCCHRICRGEDFSRGVPIGRPIRGTRVRVVDAQLQDVVPGEEGELLAGGAGVALGYWNRPELTTEKFIRDPAANAPDAHFYRTGDHVRVREDGIIEFLGRRDGQVKLRGFRIELGEIETAIRTHEGVLDCAVKLVAADSGQGYLAAYVVRNAQAKTEEKELLAYLRGLLPDHMWPAAWVFLEQLPLNPNGKVDRDALPDPPVPAAGLAAEQPVSDLERIISETWRAVMGGQVIGLDVSFFDAGGNSLQVTRLHERLSRQHGITIPLTHLFQFPSVRSLAQHLAEKPRVNGMPAALGPNTRGAAQRQALGRFQKPRMEDR